MRSLQQITEIQKVKNILQSHNRKVIDDGRTLTVVHNNQIVRHGSVSDLVKAVAPELNDERLIQFIHL